MKKFEGWRTAELQYVATMIATRTMTMPDYHLEEEELYGELIREIRNRRVKEELFQMKLAGPHDDPHLVRVKMEEE